jgi:hypothetical protein
MEETAMTRHRSRRLTKGRQFASGKEARHEPVRRTRESGFMCDSPFGEPLTRRREIMRSSEIALGILIMGMMLVAAGAASAQTLPRALWSITANGFMGDLHITSVDNQGNLSGTVFGQSISGFWDEASQKGGDIHVMLALRRSSHQVVMTDEHLDGTDMMSEFLGE